MPSACTWPSRAAEPRSCRLMPNIELRDRGSEGPRLELPAPILRRQGTRTRTQPICVIGDTTRMACSLTAPPIRCRRCGRTACPMIPTSWPERGTRMVRRARRELIDAWCALRDVLLGLRICSHDGGRSEERHSVRLVIDGDAFEPGGLEHATREIGDDCLSGSRQAQVRGSRTERWKPLWNRPSIRPRVSGPSRSRCPATHRCT